MPANITIDGLTKLFVNGQSTFAVTAVATGEYYFAVKREFTTIYKGKLSLLANQPAFICLADIFADIDRPTEFDLSVDNREDMQTASLVSGTMYPGGQSALSASSKLEYNPAVSSNWLLTSRTNNREVFVPESEFRWSFWLLVTLTAAFHSR